jgi:hypothetical protein
MLRERRDAHYEDPGSMPDRELADIAGWIEGKEPSASGDHKDLDRFVRAAVSWDDLLAQDLPRLPGVLSNETDGILIPRGGLVLLYGDSGVGKTLLTLTVAEAVGSAKPWLGLATPVGGLKVGILSLELPKLETQLRARRIAESAPGVQIVSRPDLRGAVNLLGHDQARLRWWIEHGELGLLIIDALTRVHPGEETREDLTPMLEWLDGTAKETDCTIVVIHHDRKPDLREKGEPNHLHALRGSTVLESTPGVLIHAWRHAHTRALSWAKNWFGGQPTIHTVLNEQGVPVACDAPTPARKRLARPIAPRCSKPSAPALRRSPTSPRLPGSPIAPSTRTSRPLRETA